MTQFYDFEKVELKWQKHWLDSKTFEVVEDANRPKYYCLEMLPYPSGKIHMGHVRNYSIGDAIARFKIMRGFNVLHPIGWDALGLPAEKAALEHGEHPEDWTRSNIDHMRIQLRRLGFSYSWEREFATCDPDYYRWNQWFFIQMWKRGLAYRKKSAVNWCPVDRTVLANEQVVDGRCWRCDAEVISKELPQWFLRITNYADELLEAMNSLSEWPPNVLTLQKNWIGRSEGAEVEFALANRSESIKAFTTRLDTIYGATFLVLAPEHPLAGAFAKENETLRRYIDKANQEDTRVKEEGDKEKTGVPTGHHVINPFSKEIMPIWVADYVLMEYGTGAVMAVPAHDERDLEFAEKYDLPIRPVIQAEADETSEGFSNAALLEYGTVINSGEFTGLPSQDAITKMIEHGERKGFCKKTTTYKIRDWGISRQRYWGTPIPMVYCSQCGVIPVAEEELPVVLPRDVQITGKGESALNDNEKFLSTSCPQCGAPSKRETDTMDTFIDSSWYFYRYVDPTCKEAPFRFDAAKYWFPIDLYIGGVEHAILHLLYSRFWTKMMRDLGLVNIDEPVVNQLSQGMVIKDGAKMSKSKGNIVDPDAVVSKYGADTVRLYVLFEAPPEKEVNWTDERLEGPHRLVHRIWRFVDAQSDALKTAEPIEGGEDFNRVEISLRRKTHQTLKRVTYDFERVHLNTAIAAVMELVNDLYRLCETRPSRAYTWKVIREGIEAVIILLHPMAPHVTEELWERIGNNELLSETKWPDFDDAIAAETEITVVVQVNGKNRSKVLTLPDQSDDAFSEVALNDKKIKSLVADKDILRVIVVPNRLVNIVTGTHRGDVK